MEVIELKNEGLQRSYKVVIAGAEIAAAIEDKLDDLRQRVRIPGFRPGKAPLPLLQQRYGSSLRAEVVEQRIRGSAEEILTNKQLQPVGQPRILPLEEEAAAMDADVAYTLEFEVQPQFALARAQDFEIERLRPEVTAADIEGDLQEIAKSQGHLSPKEPGEKAVLGDIVVIDFKGSIGGQERPELSGEDYHLALGAGRFIPGFEDQLVGCEQAAVRTVAVTFPHDYGNAALRGQEAVFTVDVKTVNLLALPDFNDELAKNLGAESLEDLRATLEKRRRADYSRFERERCKEKLFDCLLAAHDFPLPPDALERERTQARAELKAQESEANAPPLDSEDAPRLGSAVPDASRGAAARDAAAEDAEGDATEDAGMVSDQAPKDGAPKDEAPKDEALKDEALKDEAPVDEMQVENLAMRRLKLAFILQEVAKHHELSVGDEEFRQGLTAQARNLAQNNPKLAEQLLGLPAFQTRVRSQILEDKVVDFLLEQVPGETRSIPMADFEQQRQSDRALYEGQLKSSR